MKQLLTVLTLLLSVFHGIYAQDILKAEYFIDTDPGVGNGTRISDFSSGQPTDFTVDATGLGIGKHNLFVRVQSADYKWSVYQGKSFFIEDPSANAVAYDMVAAEYFIDTDPGVGNGVVIPNCTSADTVLNDFSVEATGLSVGKHNLFVRVKANDGKWGIYHGKTFFVEDTSTNAEAYDMVAAEYFIDTDPGIGNGIALPNFISADTVINDFSVEATGLSVGKHNLYVRVRGNNGKWSVYQGKSFFITKRFAIKC